jgi:hypothetical protein
MLTLQFKTHRDLSFFQMITGILDQLIDDDQLIVRGNLEEAEIELACNAFDAEVIVQEVVHV